MRSMAHKSNSAGQIQNTEELDKMAYRRGVVSDRAKNLSDVIDRVRYDMDRQVYQETAEEAYARGFIDGKAEGFKDGIQWSKGK